MSECLAAIPQRRHRSVPVVVRHVVTLRGEERQIFRPVVQVVPVVVMHDRASGDRRILRDDLAGVPLPRPILAVVPTAAPKQVVMLTATEVVVYVLVDHRPSHDPSAYGASWRTRLR